MRGKVISYIEMCQEEGTSLQRGMNYCLGGTYSVILMSLRQNAPYRDEIRKDGLVLIYEGHDRPTASGITNPKSIDQPEYYDSGRLTENGKFHRAAQEYKQGRREAELVRVYEKIKTGIWSDNGVFRLVDSWIEHDGTRNVFRFELEAVEDEILTSQDELTEEGLRSRTRLIPTSVKIEVWKRDRGRCVICGAADELHFDHIVPYSKGGTSLKAENIQLLCARHNLAKSAKIQ